MDFFNLDWCLDDFIINEEIFCLNFLIFGHISTITLFLEYSLRFTGPLKAHILKNNNARGLNF